MANYIQQCRACHVTIEGTGENICYQCLQRERDALRRQLDAERGRLIQAGPDRMVEQLRQQLASCEESKRQTVEMHQRGGDRLAEQLRETEQQLEDERKSHHVAETLLRQQLAEMEQDRDQWRHKFSMLQHDYTELNRIHNQETNEAVEAVRQRLAKAQEWQRSVSNAIKIIPEFSAGQWAGDKEGWGFHFEVVRWLQRHREALEQQLAEAQADRDQWKESYRLERVNNVHERKRLEAEIAVAKQNATDYHRDFSKQCEETYRLEAALRQYAEQTDRLRKYLQRRMESFDTCGYGTLAALVKEIILVEQALAGPEALGYKEVVIAEPAWCEATCAKCGSSWNGLVRVGASLPPCPECSVGSADNLGAGKPDSGSD